MDIHILSAAALSGFWSVSQAGRPDNGPINPALLNKGFLHRCLSKIRKHLSGNELYCSPNSLRQCPLPCSHFSSHWVRSFVRALTSSSRSWLYAIKSESSNALFISAPDSL